MVDMKNSQEGISSLIALIAILLAGAGSGAAKEIIMSGIVTLMEVSEPGQGSAFYFTLPG